MVDKDGPLEEQADISRLDVELETLVRQNAGFLQQLRVERLGRQLAEHGPLAIPHVRPGFSRDRLAVSLDDGNMLKLKLFWPLKVTLSALVSITWEDEVGWVVTARSTRGERVVLYAWLAQIVPDIRRRYW